MFDLDIEKLKFPIGKYETPISISEKDIKLWVKVLEKFPFELKNTTQHLSTTELNYTYRPKGWSIKQVVHHCADSHINSFIRFKLALTEDIPTIKPYDEAKWATLIDGLDDSISASLDIIESIHYKWVLLLKNLDITQLKKQFRHPETKKTYCLDEVIGLYAWHSNHHLAHINQALFYKEQFGT